MVFLEFLKSKLIGKFYSSYRTGDTWSLYFDDFWIVSYNLCSEDERELNSNIIENYAPANETIDKEDIAKSIVAATNTRKLIVDVNLQSDSSLELVFENGCRVVLPADTDIVDWHWCINDSGNDPYRDYDIACFAPGDIRVNGN